MVVWLLWGCSGDPEPAPPVVDSADACDGVDWSTDAEPFFSTWCAGCHSSTLAADERYGAPVGVDFDRWSTTVNWLDRVEATALGDDARMPPVGGADATERARVAAWIACGAPGADVAVAVDCAAATPVDTFDGVCEGPVRLTGGLLVDGDLDAPCVCGIDGPLEVRGGALRLASLVDASSIVISGGSVELPALRSSGSIDVTGGTALVAPRLQSSASIHVRDAATLVTVDLRDVEAVAGDLVLDGNAALQTVDLSRLSTVGGSLQVTENPALLAVYGELYGLTKLGGDLRFEGNLSWLGFYGIGLLEEVPGDLTIIGQDRFGIVNGFTALKRVGGDLRIESNPGLLFLEGFDQLAEVGGDLRVRANAVLSVEEAFDLLDRVGGELLVENNPQLEKLGGLQGPTAVARYTVAGSQRLTALAGGGLAAAPGGVRIADLPALSSLVGFESLDEAGSLELHRLGQLRAVEAFRGLGTLHGDLLVDDNTRLTALDGLRALRVVDGDVVIRDNPDLGATTIDGLLGALTVGGAVDVGGNQR
jgi:hypothetical protein